ADFNLLLLVSYSLFFSFPYFFFPENLFSYLSLRSVQSSLGSMNRLRQIHTKIYRGLSSHYQVKVSEVNHGMAPPSHLLDSEIPQNPKSETGDGETPVSSRRGDRETMMSVADGTIEVNFGD
ncbi:unnamed protein product, partial [Brassica oleracea var. botrytis]